MVVLVVVEVVLTDLEFSMTHLGCNNCLHPPRHWFIVCQNVTPNADFEFTIAICPCTQLHDYFIISHLAIIT